MLGAMLSVTITLCAQVAVLPLASVAVHITVVVPTGNAVGALLVIVGGVQLLLSVAVALPSTTLVAVQPLLVALLIVPGHVMFGGVTSLTSTVKLQVAVNPAASLAV
jgi:hypothetical protein